jgi:hypothetical protein
MYCRPAFFVDARKNFEVEIAARYATRLSQESYAGAGAGGISGGNGFVAADALCEYSAKLKGL